MSRPLRLVRRFGPALLIAAAFAWVVQSGLLSHLTFEEFSQRRDQLQAFVALHPWQALALYMAAGFAIAALSVPGATVLTVAGGFLFGAWVGGMAACVAVASGSTVFFLICRGAFGDFLAERAGPRVARLEEGLRENAFSYLLSLRLLVVAPMPLVNLAAGIVGAPLRSFVAATFLGMAPMSLVFSGLGAGFGHAFAQGERPGLQMASDPQILLPIVGVTLLGLFAAAHAVIRARRKRSLSHSCEVSPVAGTQGSLPKASG